METEIANLLSPTVAQTACDGLVITAAKNGTVYVEINCGGYREALCVPPRLVGKLGRALCAHAEGTRG